MKTANLSVNARSVFLRNEEIRLRVLSYTDGMSSSEILAPVYRGFLTRLVCRILREIEFEKACASRFDLGEIPDFMG